MQVEGATFPAYAGTREDWAYRILDFMAPQLAKLGIVMPPGRSVRVGVLPLSRGMLGLCHPASHSECQTINFIGLCTRNGEPTQLVHALVHEFLHAADNCQSGHRHRWAKWASQLGMKARGFDRNARFERLIDDALQAVGEPVAHVPSTVGRMGKGVPSQERMVCPQCRQHAYLPAKAAHRGYTLLCGECMRPMEEELLKAKVRPAARTSA